MINLIKHSMKYFQPHERDARLDRFAKKYGVKRISRKIRADLEIATLENIQTDLQLLQRREAMILGGLI